MSTELALPKIETITEKLQINVPRLIQGNAIGLKMVKAIQEMVIENDEQKEEAIKQLVTVREIYMKLNSLRVEVSQPIDLVKDYLMTFERPFDDKGKDNEFAKAKAVISAYDQKKLEEARKKEAEAEVLRQTNVYKAELKAAVGKQVVEMIAGQKRSLISTMSNWEKALNLENFDEKEAKLKAGGEIKLKIEVYNSCFNTAFQKRHLLNEELTKEYIESLKTDYPYEQFNATYVENAVEILNGYRAKMPLIKEGLLKTKGDKEAEEKRKAEIDRIDQENRQQVDSELKQATEHVENEKGMNIVSAEFTKQGQLSDVESVPVKYEASFTDDNQWLRPFQDAVAVVATGGKVTSIKKKNGKEYIDSIDWWLKQIALLGKPIHGIKLTELAKTMVRSKKDLDF